MKIIFVGAGGTIGKAVYAELNRRHKVIGAGRSSNDFRVNIADADSIRLLYEQVGEFDALVSTAGNFHFGPLEQLTPEHFDIGLRDKFMGEVNLVTLAISAPVVPSR